MVGRSGAARRRAARLARARACGLRRGRRASPCATSGATSRSRPSPTARSSPQADTAHRAHDPRTAARTPSRPRPRRRGVRDGGGDAPVRWYIDPIDGTHNFIRGVPLFGTLLGGRGGRRAAGRRHVRARARRALVGAGAAAAPGRCAQRRTRARRRIRVSRSTALGGRAAPVRERTATSARRGGRRASTPCSTTSGASAASATSGATRWSPRARPRRMVEVELSTWDAAAPRSSSRRPGGRVIGPRRRRAGSTAHVLVTNGVLHDELLARLANRRLTLAGVLGRAAQRREVRHAGQHASAQSAMVAACRRRRRTVAG